MWGARPMLAPAVSTGGLKRKAEEPVAQEWEETELDAFAAETELDELAAAVADAEAEAAFADALAEVDGTGAGGARFSGDFRPRKLCNYFMQGSCTKGDQCTFAHGMEELHPSAQAGEEAAWQGQGAVNGKGKDKGKGKGSVYLQIAHGELSEVPQQVEEVQEEVVAEIIGSGWEGPRQFPAGRRPRAICMQWLTHPFQCEQAAQCPHAHGLAEMGAVKACKIYVSPGSATASVSADGPMLGGSAGGSGCFGKAVPAKGGGKAFGGGGYAAAAPTGGGKAGFDGKGKGKGKDKGYGGKQALAGMSPSWGAPPALGRFPTPEGFMPTQCCRMWVQDPNSCMKGDACTFAHGLHELKESHRATCGIDRFHNMRKPNKICTFFQQNACTKGLACTFAHDPSEMVNPSAAFAS